MNTIGNKMFAYIDNHTGLTQSMVNQYNESLIFLGDEKQIFVPIINAYVGIGQTAYNNLLSRIGQNSDNLYEYNKYIHKDTVNSIYVQFSPDEIEAQRGNNTITVREQTISNPIQSKTVFKANRNVVLKGINDYELVGGLDDLGRTVSTSYTSGITVKIAHSGTAQQGHYTFTTANGQTYTYNYTYYDPYDVISIDDTKTWSYIKSSNSYLTDFITKFSAEQANRVYKNILGIESGGTIYIEKEFDEAFNYSDVTKTINEFAPVFIKTANGTYQRVTIENEAGKGFAVIYNGNVIWTNITPTNDKITINSTTYDVLSGTTLTNILDKNGDNPDNPTSTKGTKYGYIVSSDGNNGLVIIPRWYHEDTFNGSSSYINIADGIQTLKEVAYILDKITDGDDAGINLAYNISSNFIEIEKLKDWKNQIGNETVSSFKSESGNELLTVNYYSTNLWDKDRDADGASIGKVKLDIDLKLAQTYEIDGVTYVAYLPNHEGAKKSYFIYNGDETNRANYRELGANNQNLRNLIIEQNSTLNNSSDINIYTFTYDLTDPDKIIDSEVFSTVKIGDIINPSSNLQGKYIYFPYVKANYDFTKGLTDVKWVTTYVSYVNSYLNDRINNLNVSTQIVNHINALDYTDTDNSEEGQFVTKVDETDGIISVTKTKLPLDTILKNDVYYTNDIYLHISIGEAKSLHNDNIPVYKFENNKYVAVSNNEFGNYLAFDDNDYSKLYRKTSLATMTPVAQNTPVSDMIRNDGNVSYFYKQTTNNYTAYLPLDIQKENNSGSLLSSDKVAANDTIYYWNKTRNQVKYFDLSTILQKNGSTTTIFTSYITYLAASSTTNSGLADAWDVRRTIESMFQWVNIRTNKIIG